MAEPAPGPKPEIEKNALLQVRAGLKQVSNGAIWLLAGGVVSLLFRYASLGPWQLQGWVPLILRLIAEWMIISGLLSVAEGPEGWKIRELAIFSGLGTLPRPLLWVVFSVLPMLRMEWGASSVPTIASMLCDAAAFAAIAFLIDRIEVATGGEPRAPLVLAVYGCAGLGALVSLLDFLGIHLPVSLPILPLLSAALGGTLFAVTRQLHDRLGRT